MSSYKRVSDAEGAAVAFEGKTYIETHSVSIDISEPGRYAAMVCCRLHADAMALSSALIMAQVAFSFSHNAGDHHQYTFVTEDVKAAPIVNACVGTGSDTIAERLKKEGWL